MGKLPSFLKSPPFLSAIAIVVVCAALALADWPLDWRSSFWVWLGTQSGEAQETNSTTLRNVGFIVAGLLALVFAYWRSVVADKQARASEQQAGTAGRGLLNERYQKGAEMLGSQVLTARLGGIYALERLAAEYAEDYHLQIMKLFCAFVRNSKDDSEVGKSSNISSFEKPIRDDVLAIMEAVGWRGKERIALEEKVEYVLDLRGADLRDIVLTDVNLSHALMQGANLSAARLQSVDSESDLSSAQLEYAQMVNVDLSNANLNCANFSRANLISAHFTKANLSCASLDSANLPFARFFGARLASAEFDHAIVSGTRFGFGANPPAVGLTQMQLDTARAHSGYPPELDSVLDAETGVLLRWNGRNISGEPSEDYSP